jgi:gamma-glutamyltranspeptidase/glutathione hydrolase
MRKNLRILSLLLALVMALPLAVSAQDVWKPYDEQGNPLRTDRDAVGENGVVASSNFYASRAGLEILQKGGNAIDAAIATAYAIGVVEPYTSGLGGGGFMLIHSAETGEDVFIDFREIAPSLATPALWTIGTDGKVIGKHNSEGGKSVGVPGEVAGLEYALEKYGSMSRQEVMQPAIDLATEGFLVSYNMNAAATDDYEAMLKYPELGHYYLDENGMPYEIGHNYQNPDLAKTLKMIAEGG